MSVGLVTIGQVVDSSEKSGGSVTFVCGEGDFPAPVEEGVVGLALGERKVIVVPSVYTYGHYDPRQVVLVAQERMVGELEVGKVTNAPDEFGIRRAAIVRSVWEGAILVDFNHPLAGKELHFEVVVREIRRALPAQDEAESPSSQVGA